MKKSLKSFTDQIVESNSDLFKELASDIETWSKLPHNKTGLDLLLANAIVELEIDSKNKGKFSAICSSNIDFTKVISNEMIYKNGIKTMGTNPFFSKKSILTWNLKKAKFLSIATDSWEIKNFIIIKPENVKYLIKITSELLHS